jgi:biotin synthase-like enzyme
MSETNIDRATMGRLSKALAFICGADHACTVALKTAAESGTPADVKRARSLFLKLKPSQRQAAMNMLTDD